LQYFITVTLERFVKMIYRVVAKNDDHGLFKKPIKIYYIDNSFIRPDRSEVQDNGVIVDEPSEIETLTKCMKSICKMHDFKKKPLYIEVCEGFMVEKNAKLISKILNEHYGNEYVGKTFLVTGSMTIHKKNKNYKGLILLPSLAFPFVEVPFHLRNNLKDISYDNRSLEKTFSVLYSRKSYDRNRIFDYMIKNLDEQSELIFHEHNQTYYSSIIDGYKPEKYLNTKYSDVYGNKDNEFNAEDTVLYCYLDNLKRSNNCFINVVSETNYYESGSSWFTEKTIIPILTGQPFIVSSTAGIYKLLHEFGFKTFSDFWDESFDTEEYHDKRNEKFNTVLMQISKKYDTIEKRKTALNSMKEILEHNRNKMIEYFSQETKNEGWIKAFDVVKHEEIFMDLIRRRNKANYPDLF
jgi:hypothetical protein